MQLRTNLLYVFAVIIVFLIVIATMWYLVLYRVAQTVQVAGLNIMTEIGTESTYSDLTNTFITNIIIYFLIIAIIGLLIWTWVHSQKPEGYR